MAWLPLAMNEMRENGPMFNNSSISDGWTPEIRCFEEEQEETTTAINSNNNPIFFMLVVF